MRFRAFAILFFGLMLSCKAKNTAGGLENDLRTTMQAYLYQEKNNDSANIKFRVLDVVYYDDQLKNMYDCEFKVNMKTQLLDTTGTMKANISKDFKKVVRLY